MGGGGGAWCVVGEISGWDVTEGEARRDRQNFKLFFSTRVQGAQVRSQTGRSSLSRFTTSRIHLGYRKPAQRNVFFATNPSSLID